MADITMPQLGETVTEGTITKWFKAVGETVAEDEMLFEVSTDKVDSEVPSPVTGVLSEIRVAEGDTVDVGTLLAVVTEEAGAAPSADPTPAPKAAASAPAAEVPPAPKAAAATPPPAPTRAPRVADRPVPASNGDTVANGSARPVLSPIVRRLLAEHGIDSTSVKGTGRGGRVTRDDVLVHVAANPGGSPASAPSQAWPSRTGTAPAAEPAAPLRARTTGDEVIPFSNIRRRTAEHMIRSQATSAHVLTVIEVDYDGVDRVRGAERERWKQEEGFSLTYLPFVARAVVDAIRDYPRVNASVGDNELIVHNQVHLGFAVDLSFEGLIVPVIQDADTKRMRTLAREVADLAARARSRALNADEIVGSTFTITNPGSFGTLITAPVINQPQVGIVSTDGVRKRPVVVELPDGSDAIAIHPVGNLAFSFDHRAFDGAYASAFLARCRDILETRDWSQEL